MTHPAAAMELLAPAGTMAAFEAALEAGADAVYVGAPGLNARALARDFTFAEIAAMAAHARERKKKLYVAMNSLVKEGEIPLALETLSVLAGIGPDALIIQDLGLLYLVQRFFPGLAVHASTLTTVNHAMAANYFKALGFERVVLARELSFDEIGAIHRQGPVELEMFIHGAMCFSYSGLCRFSSLHGGKSSLRGQCVQPCRRRYDWLPSGKRACPGQGGQPGKGGKGGGYLFSMNDLSGIEHLAEARAAGVVSLKIEGRLRSVAYVRNTVRAYRLALDALDASSEQRAGMLDEAHRLLDASMGRKRASGFLLAGQEERLIVPRLSGSTGEVIGKVIRLETPKGRKADQAAQAQVVLQAPLRLGDRLRLYEERSGDRISFTLHSLAIKGKKAERAEAGQTVTVGLAGIESGRLRQPFHGILFRVDVSGREDKKHSALARAAARLAVPLPTPAELERLLAELYAESTAGRQTGDGRRSGHGGQGGHRSGGRGRPASPEWWLKVGTPEAMAPRYPFKVARILVELNRRTWEWALLAMRRKPEQRPLVWTLPAVLHNEQLSWYRDAIGQLRRQGAQYFQIGHIGQLGLFAEADDGRLELYGDYSCNVLNSATLRLYAARGLAGVQFSLETDRATLAAALAGFSRPLSAPAARPMQVGLTVHGRPPLFTARLDAPHFQGQRSFASPRGERFYLDRRDEAVYAHAHTVFSLLSHADELARLGVDYLVVDVSHGQPKKNAAELTALLSGRGELPPYFSGNYAGILS
ncbi:MAG: U32 family peptidase [Desulfobulbus sp.]|jgi:putative protease|uniref:U32 family peptidase n=1 Tax=Desulfobulbus sp. TaxID=895 RepID=UPI00284E9BC7|nr:U32 family peptidase [Desulfobulbus sp.]MDR2548876.1 U32 family peptidase [Desulfobulbus sp.]